MLNLPSISTFKRALLDFLRPKPQPYFKVLNNKGLTLLTRLRVGFSHLSEHKFKHGFQIRLNPFVLIKLIQLKQPNITYYIALISFITDLFFSITFKDPIPLNSMILCNILFYGNLNFSNKINSEILDAATKFLIEPLF